MSDTDNTTVIEVVYPRHRGAIGLRGSRAPLSWEQTLAPTRVEGDHCLFEIALPPGEVLELKLLRNDEEWAAGRNYTVHAGEHMLLEPCFDRSTNELFAPESVEFDGWKLTFQVLLPPSYQEQEQRRYGLLYALDGQSLFSTSEDPFGVWNLDHTLDNLYELGVMEEVLVIAVHTVEDRLGRLSPVADSKHGGGAAQEHLRILIDGLHKLVRERFRVKEGRENTAMLGSSMGGLFSFFAAWSRPDVFGKAACLSSSFWWAERHAIRLVQTGEAPEQRPVLYLDSGAAWSSLERDANLRDGFQHTRSMFRALVNRGFTPGVDLHRLTFAGLRHDADSWASRVGIPLQILFPPPVRVPRSMEEPPAELDAA